MGEFTVDLVSNASMHIHTQNHLAAFTNELLTPIDLDRDYEVALIELFHPALVPSKQMKKSFFRFSVNGKLLLDKIEFSYLQSAKTQDILKIINETIKAHAISKDIHNTIHDTPYADDISHKLIVDKLPSLSLMEDPVKKTKKVGIYPGSVNCGSNETYRLNVIFTDKNFLSLLGFDQDQYFEDIKDPNDIIRAKDTHDKSYNNNLLFIYCDIIGEHRVGDALANSIRVVPLPKENEPKMAAHTFNKPIYFPVKHNRISSISIILTDETGSSIALDYGTVYLTLHFRPQKSSI